MSQTITLKTSTYPVRLFLRPHSQQIGYLLSKENHHTKETQRKHKEPTSHNACSCLVLFGSNAVMGSGRLPNATSLSAGLSPCFPIQTVDERLSNCLHYISTAFYSMRQSMLRRSLANCETSRNTGIRRCVRPLRPSLGRANVDAHFFWYLQEQLAHILLLDDVYDVS